MRAIQFIVDGVTVVTAHDHDREVAVLDAECERLQITCDGLDAQNAAIATENDTLRKQLDEARELLKDYGYAAGDLDGRVDAWLEAHRND